jgi:hypothetical protein
MAAAVLNVVALRAVGKVRAAGNRKLQADQGNLVGTTMYGLQSIETLKAGGNESDFFTRWAGFQAKVVTGTGELAVPSLLVFARDGTLVTAKGVEGLSRAEAGAGPAFPWVWGGARIGRAVTLANLKARPELNGASGVVVGATEASARFSDLEHCGVVRRIPDLGRRYGEQVARVRLEAVGEPVKHHGAFQVGQPFRQDAEVALAVKGSIGPE